MYKKRYDLNLLLLNEKAFNFHNIFISEYKAYKC